MKKLLLVSASLLLIGAGCPLLQTNTNSTPQPAPLQKVTTSTMVDKMNRTMSGSYETYDESKLARATTGRVVLFFKAGWCPTCKGVDADITAKLGNIPEDLSILIVDYDSSIELRKKYGVTYQHTFVQVNERGELIKKWSASPTLKDIVANLK